MGSLSNGSASSDASASGRPHFPGLPALQRAIHQFIAEWNEIAHPFRWTAASFETILANVDATLAANPPLLADGRLTAPSLARSGT